MGDEEVDSEVNDLFNEIWDVEITHKDTPPQKT